MDYSQTSAEYAIKNFLINGNNELELKNDFDLIESSVLDSLQFVNFILLLESITGNSIDIATVRPEQFRTVDKIKQNFLFELKE